MQIIYIYMDLEWTIEHHHDVTRYCFQLATKTEDTSEWINGRCGFCAPDICREGESDQCEADFLTGLVCRIRMQTRGDGHWNRVCGSENSEDGRFSHEGHRFMILKERK